MAIITIIIIIKDDNTNREEYLDQRIFPWRISKDSHVDYSVFINFRDLANGQ